MRIEASDKRSKYAFSIRNVVENISTKESLMGTMRKMSKSQFGQCFI